MKQAIWVIITFLLVSITFATKEECENNGFIWHNNQCFECQGEVIEENNEFYCKTCNEGFMLVNGTCILPKPKSDLGTSTIDKYLQKYFPDNPFLGLIIVILLLILIYKLYKNRNLFKDKFKI